MLDHADLAARPVTGIGFGLPAPVGHEIICRRSLTLPSGDSPFAVL
ncbi:hypothetical protein [Actinacidiphila alni]